MQMTAEPLKIVKLGLLTGHSKDARLDVVSVCMIAGWEVVNMQRLWKKRKLIMRNMSLKILPCFIINKEQSTCD